MAATHTDTHTDKKNRYHGKLLQNAFLFALVLTIKNELMCNYFLYRALSERTSLLIFQYIEIVSHNHKIVEKKTLLNFTLKLYYKYYMIFYFLQFLKD